MQRCWLVLDPVKSVAPSTRSNNGTEVGEDNIVLLFCSLQNLRIKFLLINISFLILFFPIYFDLYISFIKEGKKFGCRTPSRKIKGGSLFNRKFLSLLWISDSRLLQLAMSPPLPWMCKLLRHKDPVNARNPPIVHMPGPHHGWMDGLFTSL